MNGRTTRKLVRDELRRTILRPRPWWCPTFVYHLAARLVLRPVKQ